MAETGPGKIAGISSMSVDGVPTTAKGMLKYQPSGYKREAKVGMDGKLAGFKVTGEPPWISVTLLMMPGTKVADIMANTNIQITVNTANGGVVNGHSMTPLEAIEVDNEEGEFEVKWVGLSVVES